jgi:SSS family solute:Na+ symporter
MDYNVLVVACYFAFMVLIGLIFQRMASRSASDYFRGGGKMLWWMVGASAFMTQFSAWTFTGAAGKAYTDGFVVTAVFVGNCIGYLAAWKWFAARMRQIRVDTPTEAIRRRFGGVNEQFFTWAIIPLSILNAGVWLNGLGLFVSAVLGFDIVPTIYATGIAVLLISLISGAWGVVASDFVQALVVAVVSVACAIVALVVAGGPGPMIANYPGGFLIGPNMNYPVLIVGSFLFFFVKQIQSINNLQDSYRFLNAKDSAQASKAALFAMILMIVGAIIWFIPPWVAASVIPGAGLVHSELGAKSGDAVYLVFAEQYMPVGTVGLLMAGLFAATMSSMDSALNRNAGIFVRSFYAPIMRRGAEPTERELLRAGQVVSVINGALILLMAQFFNSLTELSLFDLMMNVSTLLQSPILVPLFFGVFIRRTPTWAPWATVVFGLIVSLLLVKVWTPDAVARLFDVSWTRREASELSVMMNIGAHLFLTGGFFCLTTLFYRRREVPADKVTDGFFADLSRPEVSDGRPTEADIQQRHKLGLIVTTAGAGLVVMMAIPNPLWGRLLFLGCAAGVLLIGVLLLRSARVRR